VSYRASEEEDGGICAEASGGEEVTEETKLDVLLVSIITAGTIVDIWLFLIIIKIFT